MLLVLPTHPQVLAELKEYATEVDVDFVRKAVRAIGRCAIKVEVRHVVIICPSFTVLYFPQSHPSVCSSSAVGAVVQNYNCAQMDRTAKG